MTDAAAQTIRVGHSPDSDDAFMFYALTHDKLDTGGLRFVHQLEDIETLNKRAMKGELEVSAVSIHAYAYLAEHYALLGSGSSMGDRYGPTLVTREPMTLGRPARQDDRRAGAAHDGLSDVAALPGPGCADRGHAVRQDLAGRRRRAGRRRPVDSRGAALLRRQGDCTRSPTWASGGTSRPACRCRWGATWSARTWARRWCRGSPGS